MQSLHRQLAALRRNINAGTRLSLLRRPAAEDFSVSLDQLVWLIVFNLLLAAGVDFITSLPQPAFNSYAITASSVDIMLFLFVAWLLSRTLLSTHAFMRLGVYLYSMSPFLYLVGSLLEQAAALVPAPLLTAYGVLLVLYAVWVLCALGWMLVYVAGGFSRRTPVAFALMVVLWAAPVYYLVGEYASWWYPAAAPEEDAYAAFRGLDVEGLYYRQPALLEAHLQALLPQREAVEDLYFVGFAGYALQDIFRNETRYARELFDTRFGTAGRSLLLVNHLDTRDELPLASASNLQRTLARLGEVMDRDNDIAVIFLTSHGGEAELSVNFWPLGLNALTPAMLRQYLDEAGIRWRIIMVSACYSGHFMGALQDEHTAIMTAAAADRTSFGCDDRRTLTYFGEALLQNQLRAEYSIPGAFSATAREIERREAAEQLDPSRPQIHVGAAMQDKLQRLAERLAADAGGMQHCGGDGEDVAGLPAC